MSTIRDAIAKAVKTEDATLAGKIASKLRSDVGMDYNQIYTMVNKVSPIDQPAWDALLYASDEEQ